MRLARAERGEQHAARSLGVRARGRDPQERARREHRGLGRHPAVRQRAAERVGVVGRAERRERGHGVPRALDVAEVADQRRAAGRIAELGERVRGVEPHRRLGVLEQRREVLDRALVADRAERERGGAGHLWIAVAERLRERRERARRVDLGDRGGGLEPQIGRAVAQRLGQRLKAVGVADRAERDRGVLAHDGDAVGEPLHEVRQRGRIAELAERGARLGAHLGPVIVERADQRLEGAVLLGRLRDVAERVRGGGARPRAAPRQVAQRGLERDRRARELERHGPWTVADGRGLCALEGRSRGTRGALEGRSSCLDSSSASSHAAREHAALPAPACRALRVRVV
jgi:hypothetical protein